ncbi:MAG: hypothetical protein A2161_02810 [Candidatus Schekmanbacteria bacterium RBG_13_48_7]|uniref:Lipid A biosynthesis acyltransferase n=1 Tax=Candidatus Schekmanbacteria bacterium RBG_13_48_7 TaxID=1817878 RepID=A0A1F7RTE6_9BACT|nr:MAG: hypothetical protein A2161_02810 [Candidatus Schekmanbacteria bacterium RBG_13_48_7]
MKKTLFNLLRDIYYMKICILIKLISPLNKGADILARFMGLLRYHAGYIGQKNGKKYFLNIISESLPHLSQNQTENILREFWISHQRFFLELFFFMNLNEKFVSESVTFSGLEHLDAAISKGNGAVLAVPHMGNERLIHLALAIKRYPIAVITGDFTGAGPFVRHVKLQSTKKFHPFFFPDDSPRKFIRFITTNNAVLQISPPADPVKKETRINFLGHQIMVSPAAFRIARQAGVPLVPALCLRRGIQKFEIYFHEQLNFDAQYDKSYNYQKEMNFLYQWYESFIRKYPDQFNWIWLATRINFAKTDYTPDV